MSGWLKRAIRWLRAGLTWTMLTVLAGLLPLWIRLGGNYFHSSLPPLEITTNEILQDGMLLFFSMAVVASITVDYYLSEQQFSKYTHVYAMLIFPAILFIGVLVTYFLVLTSLGGNASDDPSALHVEILILTSSCVYAFIHKASQITRAEAT